MHRLLSPKSPIKHCISLAYLSQTQTSQVFSSKARPIPGDPHDPRPLMSSERIKELIESQTDPLLAKEIFDYTSKLPNFRHSYSSYIVLILKLGRARYFSFVDDILVRLESQNYTLTPELFYYIIGIYGEADLPDKALETFTKMSKFGCKPLTKHFNYVLKILGYRRSHAKASYVLFKRADYYGVEPDTESYNIVMRAMCGNNDLSIAYKLFNKMFERGTLPDEESYKILMQGLIRKGQAATASKFLEDMLNKGYTPGAKIYTTMINGLCNRDRIDEAYRLLRRMKVKGCNPDIIHYNAMLAGFCREGRAMEARKVLEDMEANGCLPNETTYRSLINCLCQEGKIHEAKRYLSEMVSGWKGLPLSPHISSVHLVVRGLCRVGRAREASDVVVESLGRGEVPHSDTWGDIVPSLFDEVSPEEIDRVVVDEEEEEVGRKGKVLRSKAVMEMYPLMRDDNDDDREVVVHKDALLFRPK